MTEEEDQFGVPLEVVHQVLAENRALIRLLAPDADDYRHAGETAAWAGMSASALLSTYRGVLELLEILSATSQATGAIAPNVEAGAPQSADPD